MESNVGTYNPDIANLSRETGGNLDDIKNNLDSLVSFEIPEHDQITLTYVNGGNGNGEIETITYKLSSVTVQTKTIAYDSDNRIIDVTIS